MSLTRDEWTEMWDSIKRIEDDLPGIRSVVVRIRVRTEVNRIKGMIQQAIGQME